MVETNILSVINCQTTNEWVLERAGVTRNLLVIGENEEARIFWLGDYRERELLRKIHHTWDIARRKRKNASAHHEMRYPNVT